MFGVDRVLRIFDNKVSFQIRAIVPTCSPCEAIHKLCYEIEVGGCSVKNVTIALFYGK